MKTIPERSAETVLLIQHLRDSSRPTTYDALSETAGRNVRGPCRGNLNAARRVLLHEDGVVFEAVHKIGLKRLADSEIVSSSDGSLARIRRAARRGAEKLTKVKDFSNLPREAQTKHNQNLAAFGALRQFSNQKKIAKLVVSNPTVASLPIGETLKQFEKNEEVK